MTAAGRSGRDTCRPRDTRHRIDTAGSGVVVARRGTRPGPVVISTASPGRELAPDRDGTASPLAARLGPAAGTRTECVVCGFAAGSVPSEDLAAAVLHVPARYREVLGRAHATPPSDARVIVSGTSRWSVVERVVHVADWFHGSARVVTAMAAGDTEHCSLVHVDAARAGANGWPVQVALGSLMTAAGALGRAVSSVGLDAWDQFHDVSGGQMTIRNVAERALHEARHHLVEIAAVLDAQEAEDQA